MKIKIGILLAVVALAAVATGSARADATAADTYVQCSDGTVWVLDSTIDVAWFGDAVCDGYTVVSAPADTADTSDSSDSTGDTASISGGSDIGIGAASNASPDASAYVTQVQCPNGQIWAVASGDDFVCPAS